MTMQIDPEVDKVMDNWKVRTDIERHHVDTYNDKRNNIEVSMTDFDDIYNLMKYVFIDIEEMHNALKDVDAGVVMPDDCDEGRSPSDNYHRKKYMSQNWGVELTTNLSDEQALDIAKAVVYRISEYVDEIEPGFMTMTVAEDPSNVLQDPDTVAGSLMVTDDGVYKVEAREVDSVSNLDEIKESIAEQYKSMYESQLRAAKNTYNARIEELEDELEDAEQEGLVQGIKTLRGMDDEWTVENINGRAHLVYDGEINIEYIKFDGELYEATEQAKETFYIKRLQIPIKKQLTSKFACRRGHHPNVSSSGTVCVGSLTPAGLEHVIENVLETVKTAVPERGYNNSAQTDIRNNIEEYAVGYGDESDDDDDGPTVWSADDDYSDVGGNDDDDSHVCDECGQSFSSSNALWGHLSSHSDD